MSEDPRPGPGTRLCRLDEIADPGTRSFAWGDFGNAFRLLVVRQGDAVFGYVNDCPHAHHPLDGGLGRALDPAGTRIVCASHGATFGIADGFCSSGPCKDRYLTPFSVTVERGEVLVGPRLDFAADGA